MGHFFLISQVFFILFLLFIPALCYSLLAIMTFNSSKIMKHFIKIFEKLFLGTVFCAVLLLFLILQYTLFAPENYARQVLLCNGKKCISKALFSPDNGIQKVLLGLIAEEKKNIFIAAFTLTNMEIAQALIKAHRRGVKVAVIVDGDKMRESYSKVPLLYEAGITVYFYPKDKKERERFYKSLMHHKFMIFERSIIDHPILVTGSYNYTRSAETSNQENVVILSDSEVVNSFKKHFEVLKGRCRRINAPHKIETFIDRFGWLRGALKLIR